MTQRSRDPAPSRQSAAPEADGPPPDVVAFIRFCHRRRQAGWPELYDEMCAVAARREFKGWGHEQLAAHGLAFSLQETPRLAGWVRAVLTPPDQADPASSQYGSGTPRPLVQAAGA
jgi:hypothetical protein